MLPRITFNQLALDVEKAIKNDISDQPTSSAVNMPVIPPRRTAEATGALPQDPDDIASWFMVLSPRESRGVAGPFSVPQLRQMYKYGELEDKTLLWSEGADDWHQLIHQRILRPKLLQIPLVPPRVGSYNSELEVFDPILKLPPITSVRTAVKLDDFELSRSCVTCGGLAVAHMPLVGEQIPDLFKCLDEIGTTQYASEILPGFMWIGNAGSSKKRSLLKLGITLLINCGSNMSNPFSNPPYYRCRDAPLKENPGVSDFSATQIDELVALFQKVYDWVELERIYPEHGARSDPPSKEYRGPTDKYGMPLKVEKPFRKLEGDNKTFPPRVLLWSKLGLDRPCVIGASYLIRRYGVTVDRAVEIIRRNRPSCVISDCYLRVLEMWARRYALGTLLCMDCRAQALQESDSDNVAENAVGSVLQTANAVSVASPREESYSSFAQLMKTHFPLLVKNTSEVSLLADTSLYLVKLLSGFCTASPWCGLMDLDLGGRGLSDLTLAILIQLLAGNDLIYNLRILNLQSNFLSNVAMKALLVAFFPVEDMADGDEYVLDEGPPPPHHTSAHDDDELSEEDSQRRDVCELMALDLSHNRLEEYGAKYLCYFLKQCHSLTTLDVSDNELDDFLCADIVSCLERPLPDFAPGVNENKGGHKHSAAVVYGDDDSIHSGEHLSLHNSSITSLNIGFNKSGPQTANALSLMLKRNSVLNVLRVELSPGLPPSGFRDISNSMRVYNSTLCELSLSHTPITVKSAECVARMLDSMDSHIARLELSCCGLKHQHIEAMVKYLPSSKYLNHVDLSGNSLTDSGAVHLAEIIRGKRDFNDMLCPPLQYLDFSNCGLHANGCGMIVREISLRSSLRFLNISHNSLDPVSSTTKKSAGNSSEECEENIGQCMTFYDALACSKISELRMNSCSLKSDGASALFARLAVKHNALSTHLRTLQTSSNHIADSATTSLCAMLESNTVLELLDLSFNDFTHLSADFFRHSVKVVSTSDRAKKICGLTVNLLGNKCDPYVFDTPGLSRSKNTLIFGVNANPHDSLNNGFSHVSQRARGNFLVRKELDTQYRKHFPLDAINSAI